MSETNPLRIRLSRIASSDEPNSARLTHVAGLSIGDIREVMRLLANGDGWYRTAVAHRTTLMSREKFIRELADEDCSYGDDCPSGARHYVCLRCKAARELATEGKP